MKSDMSHDRLFQSSEYALSTLSEIVGKVGQMAAGLVSTESIPEQVLKIVVN